MSTAPTVSATPVALYTPTPSACAALSTLPAEILHQITSYFGRKTLLSLLRIKLLQPFAEPLVYTEIRIGPRQYLSVEDWARKFAASALRSRALVRKVEVIVDGQVDKHSVVIGNAVSFLPNLASLSLVTTCRSPPAIYPIHRPSVNGPFLGAGNLRQLDIDATILGRGNVVVILRACCAIIELKVQKWPENDELEDLRVDLGNYEVSVDEKDHQQDAHAAPGLVLPLLRYVEGPAVLLAALLPGRKIQTAVVTDAVIPEMVDLSTSAFMPLSKLVLKADPTHTFGIVCDTMTSLEHLSLDNVSQHALQYWCTHGIPPNMANLQELTMLDIDALKPSGFYAPLDYDMLHALDAQLRRKLRAFKKLILYQYGMFNEKTLLYATGMVKMPPRKLSHATRPLSPILVPRLTSL